MPVSAPVIYTQNNSPLPWEDATRTDTMASTATSTDPHEIFTEWALANGVIDSSVKPHRFEGRGLGMVATKNIKV